MSEKKQFPAAAYVAIDGEGDEAHFIFEEGAVGNLLADDKPQRIAQYQLVEVREYVAKTNRRVTSKESA